ncbi:MAG: MazG nucleotide pyrophosphohydrolase domain-containing protein [Candidatus Electrothrix sp. GW3-4]|uniref:MazG nucleotide pyrophosphohydrolase domain-containing protein n=1 Tax=Candidatus Electrothrix sp. GW3-4 TaxID=3126740 RepID=UPI0030D602E3
MYSKPEPGSDVNPFQRLDQIVRALRSPDGCPWDQRQTRKTLKKYLLEEAAELAEAIDKGDQEHIREEIGDMYFILALLALLSEEQDGIPAIDPVQRICDKMVRRHPHVFARQEGQSLSEQELREQWERIKQEEKIAGKKK